jgi:hypothetical protein
LFEALLALPLQKRTSIRVSIRISVGCFDILGEMLGMMEKFIMERCMLGLCVLGRGGTFSRLHLQIICKIYISSLVTLNKTIKNSLGWFQVARNRKRRTCSRVGKKEVIIFTI